MSMRLVAAIVGGTSEPWAALGFVIGDDGHLALGNGAIAFDGGEPGMHGLAVEGLDSRIELEGIPLVPGHVLPPTSHPNGASELDHIVVMTDSLERTSAALTDTLGLERRRIRETETVRQAFHRFDDPADGASRGCIVELVESPRVDRTGLFGLVVNVADLDAVAGDLGPDLLGNPKAAVQRGRRIATVRTAAGLGVAVALMSPA